MKKKTTNNQKREEMVKLVADIFITEKVNVLYVILLCRFLVQVRENYHRYPTLHGRVKGIRHVIFYVSW